MMRVLALDVGDKRIGIAVSDPLGIPRRGLKHITGPEILKRTRNTLRISQKNMLRCGFCSACREIWTAATASKAKR